MIIVCEWRRIVLAFVVLLEVPIPVASVDRPAGWVDDDIFKGEEKFSSGLSCYDCIDCDEAFSYEHRECFSAINCYVIRAKLTMDGFSYTDKKFWAVRLPPDEYDMWVKTWYKRNTTIRGCSDYGFNCPQMMEKHKTEGYFKTPYHMMDVIECEECGINLCNSMKTEDTPMVDRAFFLSTDYATSIYSKHTIITFGIVCITLMIINALRS